MSTSRDGIATRSSTRLLLLLLLTFSSSSLSSTSTNTSTICSICPNPYDSITLPNATIPIFGTCGDLNAAIGFVSPDSDTCRLIHSVSSLCGCPVSESSCFLCNDNYEGPIDSSRPVPYLLDAPGVNVTCEIAQAYLHSIEASDSTCSLTKSVIGAYCGCPSSTGSGNVAGNSGKTCSLCKSGQAAALANRTIATGLDLPFLQTCEDLENIAKTYWQDGTETCQAVQTLGTYCGCETTTASSTCTLCANGTAISSPSKTLPFLKDKFNLAGIAPTCGIVDAALQSLSSSDPLCGSVRLFGTYCGCPPIADHCTYCPKPDDRVTEPNRVVKEFSRISGLNDLTCEDIMWTQYQMPRSNGICWMLQGKNFVCGCNNGQFEYLGTDTIAKKRAMVWIPRFSAFLSVCGSLYIMQDVYRNHRNPLDQYHELVASISFFDFWGSLATMFTTLPIPELDRYGVPTGIYGALGNTATCKTQGFFVQLGYTGIFYNFALSVFYVLVVNYNYRDRDLKRVRKYFHIPAVVGIALACAGIPYYDNFIWLCQIPSRPIIESYRYMFIFVFYPIVIAILGSGVSILLVYVKVRKLSQASRKWRFSQRFGKGGGTGGKLARQVFWQAFFFVLALYGTWPLLMVAEFSSTTAIKIYDHHWVWVLTLAIAPLQGLFNCFVYARPKMMKFWRQRRRRRQRRQPPVVRSASWARRAMRMSFPAQNGFDLSGSSSDDCKSIPLDDALDDDQNPVGAVPRQRSRRVPIGNDNLDETESSSNTSWAKRMMRMPSSAENHISCSESSSPDELKNPTPEVPHQDSADQDVMPSSAENHASCLKSSLSDKMSNPTLEVPHQDNADQEVPSAIVPHGNGSPDKAESSRIIKTEVTGVRDNEWRKSRRVLIQLPDDETPE